MDHLNIFHAYKNKSPNHEDELTRSFLILVKHIPVVQMMFFNMIQEELRQQNEERLTNETLFIEEIYTQLSSSNKLFSLEDKIENRTLISIIISDDLYDKETEVKNVDRDARYDGVILASPSLLFIIENKPYKENIWSEQLSPNINDEMNIDIVDKPCRLSWRDTISRLHTLIEREMVHGIEKSLIEDFTQYVDHFFPKINPYTSFHICHNHKYLLNKRCQAIMSSITINGKHPEVIHHRGWKQYIPSRKNTIKQIALDAETSENDWKINVTLYAGDTMNSARDVYRKLDVEKLIHLKNRGFKFRSNFHLAYRSTNLTWCKGALDFQEYIHYWKKDYRTLKQIKRDEFETYVEKLVDDRVILPEEFEEIQRNIFAKKYNHLNICPGFEIIYSWSKEEAKQLDKEKKFEADFKNILDAVFDVFGEKL